MKSLGPWFESASAENLFLHFKLHYKKTLIRDWRQAELICILLANAKFMAILLTFELFNESENSIYSSNRFFSLQSIKKKIFFYLKGFLFQWTSRFADLQWYLPRTLVHYKFIIVPSFLRIHVPSATGPCPCPREMELNFLAILISSANLFRSAAGSVPVDSTKIRGVVGEESLYTRLRSVV